MLYIIIILGLVAVDQFTKWLVVSNLVLGEPNAIFSLLNFTYVQNTGAAFSILSNNTVFLILLTVVALGIVVAVWRKPYIKPYHLYLAVIIGGALGNFIDRLFRGYVVDFLQVTFINFPVFNFADMVLCVGVFLLALKILFTKEEKTDGDHLQSKGK